MIFLLLFETDELLTRRTAGSLDKEKERDGQRNKRTNLQALAAPAILGQDIQKIIELLFARVHRRESGRTAKNSGRSCTAAARRGRSNKRRRGQRRQNSRPRPGAMGRTTARRLDSAYGQTRIGARSDKARSPKSRAGDNSSLSEAAARSTPIQGGELLANIPDSPSLSIILDYNANYTSHPRFRPPCMRPAEAPVTPTSIIVLFLPPTTAAYL